jgi:uncharacterized DUF497 family protein
VTSVTGEPAIPAAIFKESKARPQLRLNVTTFGVTMNLEWDEAKNRSNIRKHEFDFADAEEMFRGVLLIRPDTREDYGEERWIGIGMIQGRFAFVTVAEPSPESLRVISLRKATYEERQEYENALQDRLEAS